MGTVRFWFIPFPFLVPEPFGSGSSNASTSPFCTDLTYPILKLRIIKHITSITYTSTNLAIPCDIPTSIISMYRIT